MKLFCCCILDKSVGSYLPPFYGRSKGECLRSFSDAVNDKSSNIAKHPDDYELFFVGTFEDGNGHFSPAGPEFIISAREVMTPA